MGTDTVRELVHRYKVCYDISPEYGTIPGGVRPIGFEIELAGTHDHDPRVPLPTCEECARVAVALRAIAQEAIPDSSRSLVFSVRAPRIAHHFTPKHENRPDLTTTISVLHQDGVQKPIDELETRGRDEVVARLRGLGVPEGSWHE